jgi:hypothetical protein
MFPEEAVLSVSVAETPPTLVVVRSDGSVCSCEVVAAPLLSSEGDDDDDDSRLVAVDSRVSVASEVIDVGREV